MEYEKAEQLGKYEVGWWISHGRKNIAEARDNMIKEYMLQYGLSEEIAKKAVDLRIRAAMEHDKAEELERAGKIVEALPVWKRAEKLLAEHFAHLP